MENHSDTSREDRLQSFSKSIGVIAAVADLLRFATENAGSKQATALDDTSLLTIANTLYQEALIADSLYVQLQDIHQHSVSDAVSIYTCHPQMPIPLDRLSLQQLQDALQEASLRIETLFASSDDDPAHEESRKDISSLRASIAAIEQEISRRSS